MTDQKKLFLELEGNKFHSRNRIQEPTRIYENDLVVNHFKRIRESYTHKISVVDVGCGQGGRLGLLKDQYSDRLIGIDPSSEAIKEVKQSGIEGYVATADDLPLQSRSIDVLIYSFSLYLCDREDLFKILYESNRVLKKQGWIIIYDFWAKNHTWNIYKHNAKIKSFKLDLPSMFTWHPFYTVMDHTIRAHNECKYTDCPDEWTAVTTIRKNELKE